MKGIQPHDAQLEISKPSLPTAKTEDEMQSRLLLNIVVRKRATILKLFTSEDKTLLIGWDTLLVLDLRFDIINGVGGLHLQGYRLAGERLDENLHTTTKAEDEVEGGLLLDVVIRKSSSVLKLFAGEDETLLIRRDPVQTMSHHRIFERKKY